MELGHLMDDGNLVANASQLSPAVEEAQEVRQVLKARDIALQADGLLEKSKS
jgi:hypothetical protein